MRLHTHALLTFAVCALVVGAVAPPAPATGATTATRELASVLRAASDPPNEEEDEGEADEPPAEEADEQPATEEPTEEDDPPPTPSETEEPSAREDEPTVAPPSDPATGETTPPQPVPGATPAQPTTDPPQPVVGNEAISISPTSGAAGTTITVTGTAWMHDVYKSGVPLELAQNYGNGNLVRLTGTRSGPPDAVGSFTTQLTVPLSAEPGLITVIAITGGSAPVDVLFTVTGEQGTGPRPPQQIVAPKTIEVSPGSIPAGERITITGRNFTPGQSVIIDWCFDGPLPEFPVVEDDGSFVLPVTVPVDAPHGPTCVSLPSHQIKTDFTITAPGGSSGGTPRNPGQQQGQRPQPPRGDQPRSPGGGQPVLPSPDQLTLPFPRGETWYVCRGYKGAPSHSSVYALDLTVRRADLAPNGCWGDQNASAGRVVVAPGAGNAVQFGADFICLNLDSGKSMAIGHLSDRASGRVERDATIGKVASFAKSNGDYAHIHIQVHLAHGCAGGGPTAPFSDANEARFEGVADLPDIGGTNQHKHVALTRH